MQVKTALGMFAQAEHGIAVCWYHLGHLYSKFAHQLVLPYGCENQGDSDFRVYSYQEANLIALECFEKAFDSFIVLNHLAGIFISRREAAAVCGGTNNVEKHSRYAAEYSKYELQY
jgi:hypothetical protein